MTEESSVRVLAYLKNILSGIYNKLISSGLFNHVLRESNFLCFDEALICSCRLTVKKIKK